MFVSGNKKALDLASEIKLLNLKRTIPMTQRNNNLVLQPSESVKVYVGLDVHKSKWVVSIYREGINVKSYSMEPCASLLISQLKDLSREGQVFCCYEAGFSGFWLQRLLQQAGLNCDVVHAADIPSTDRTKKRKTDLLDSQTLALMLSRNLLNSIYVPSEEQEKIRGLVRSRQSMAKDKRRSMCRIRSCLNRSGLSIPMQVDQKLWTQPGQKWLEEQAAMIPELMMLLKSYQSNRQLEAQAIKELNKHIKSSEKYGHIHSLLRSIPGVGRLSSALLIGEMGQMERFKNLDHLAGYCGLVPDERSSGDKTRILGLTKRRNSHLRTALVESAWMAIRVDEGLRQTYQKALAQGKPTQVAIIKVARRLLNRIRALWLQKRPYDKAYTPVQKGQANQQTTGKPQGEPQRTAQYDVRFSEA